MTSPHPKRAQAKRAKAPKASVLFISPEIIESAEPTRRQIPSQLPCLLLPMSTAKQARAAARFWNLGEEERVEEVAKKLYNLDTANLERQQAENNRNIRPDSFLYDHTQHQCWGHRSLDVMRTDGVSTHERYRIRAITVLNLITPTK